VEPTFDAYGVMVLFAADRDGAPEIYEVSKSGSDLKRLTWDGLGARTPCATPSKNHILVSEKGRIYLYSLQERSRKMLSFKGDSEPDWYPH
jgi:Tol biopolymer transport system component